MQALPDVIFTSLGIVFTPSSSDQIQYNNSILSNCIFDAGYGIFRKLREGNGRNKNYIKEYDWGDGLFVKLSASYRIRL